MSHGNAAGTAVSPTRGFGTRNSTAKNRPQAATALAPANTPTTGSQIGHPAGRRAPSMTEPVSAAAAATTPMMGCARAAARDALTTDSVRQTASSAADRGVKVIIAGAGGAAHLPGMVASATVLPVIGVPVPLKYLDGLDSLLSIAQMPPGVPVACVGLNNSTNAAVLAVQMLAVGDPSLRGELETFKANFEKAAADSLAAAQDAR